MILHQYVQKGLYKTFVFNTANMIIQQIIGTLKDLPLGNRKIDVLSLEWYETAKRIQRKHTQGGMEIAIKFLKEGQRLQQNDVLYMDDEKMVVVDILPCDAITVKPRNLWEMGSVCYEIGNKHLPVFIQNNEVLIPYEEPIFNWLAASGYNTSKDRAKLLDPLKTNVQPHSHSEGGSLFSKIVRMGK